MKQSGCANLAELLRRRPNDDHGMWSNSTSTTSLCRSLLFFIGLGLLLSSSSSATFILLDLTVKARGRELWRLLVVPLVQFGSPYADVCKCKHAGVIQLLTALSGCVSPISAYSISVTQTCLKSSFSGTNTVCLCKIVRVCMLRCEDCIRATHTHILRGKNIPLPFTEP